MVALGGLFGAGGVESVDSRRVRGGQEGSQLQVSFLFFVSLLSCEPVHGRLRKIFPVA